MSEPRKPQVGDYFTDGKALYEIVEAESDRYFLLNCSIPVDAANLRNLCRRLTERQLKESYTNVTR